MKPFYLLILITILLFNQGCNTLYNTKVVDIEIVEPGKVKFPQNYRKVAVRYNNVNVSPNPHFQNSNFLNKIVENNTNIDSIASEIYFGYFIDEIRKQYFFDSVIEIAPQDYSNTNIIDTIPHDIAVVLDSISKKEKLSGSLNAYLFSEALKKYPMEKKKSAEPKFLHPQLALYQPKELQDIVDSTEADLLISLDYFSCLDGIYSVESADLAIEVVYIKSYWNFYDLTKMEYSFLYNHNDTIIWQDYARYANGIKKVLPPPKDAVLNAADIAGTNLANFMVPHWSQVQRMYYQSGHIELKQTNQLIKDGKWIEAAKIWKANVNNPNKAIAAKSKFNMGLVCEMQDKLDAALGWVVESYYVYGQENEEHARNCKQYIRILAQRKQDIVKLNQM